MARGIGRTEELRARLAAALRSDVCIVGESSGTLAYSDFAASLPSPGAAAAVACGAGGPAIIAIERRLAFHAVERTLGASRPGIAPDRPPTPLEWKLIERLLLDLAQAADGEASTLLAREGDPRALLAMPASGRVAFVRWRVEAGGFLGDVAVAWPLPAEEGVDLAVLLPLPPATLDLGTVIRSGRRAGEPLDVEVDGVPRFAGELGSLRGRVAVRLRAR